MKREDLFFLHLDDEDSVLRKERSQDSSRTFCQAPQYRHIVGDLGKNLNPQGRIGKPDSFRLEGPKFPPASPAKMVHLSKRNVPPRYLQQECLTQTSQLN